MRLQGQFQWLSSTKWCILLDKTIEWRVVLARATAGRKPVPTLRPDRLGVTLLEEAGVEHTFWDPYRNKEDRPAIDDWAPSSSDGSSEDDDAENDDEDRPPRPEPKPRPPRPTREPPVVPPPIVDPPPLVDPPVEPSMEDSATDKGTAASKPPSSSSSSSKGSSSVDGTSSDSDGFVDEVFDSPMTPTSP